MLIVEAAPLAPDDLVAIGVPMVTGGDAGAGVFGGLGNLGGAASATTALLLSDPVDGQWLRHQGFTGAVGQSLVLRSAGGGPSIVLLGLGSGESIDGDRWRRAGAALVRAAGEGGTATLVVPDDTAPTPEEIGSAVAEGAMLAAYRFDHYRSKPRPPAVDRLVLVGADGLGVGVRRGSTTAKAVVFARDLINTPPSDMTPRHLAERVTSLLADQPRTVVEVWDEGRIANERLGALLGVSRGSAEPPRLVRATYEPEPVEDQEISVPHVVLVGKGITFDSGGLSLKTADGMTTMKTDMSGAAIVLCVLSACAALEVPIRVTALAPMAENMPGGRAIKPGDVLTARNGSTIEVLNTDAEGRLILADALSLAAELEPDAIIDVATLTGAAAVALGTGVAALFGSNDELVDSVKRAGERAGERLWAMPLPDDYGEHIDSDVADMKNMGRAGQAGAIAAGMLLSRFVGDVPWAHLDIAGTGRSTESVGYLSKGGTAFGVRTLLELLEHYGS